MSVRCGLAKRLFDAQKTLAKLTPKQQRKRRLAKKPCDSNSDRFKQAKLIKFFVSELDPTHLIKVPATTKRTSLAAIQTADFGDGIFFAINVQSAHYTPMNRMYMF